MYCIAEGVGGKLGVLVEAGRRARVCYPVRCRRRDLRILCCAMCLSVLLFFYALQLTSDMIFRGCVWMRGYTPSLFRDLDVSASRFGVLSELCRGVRAAERAPSGDHSVI